MAHRPMMGWVDFTPHTVTVRVTNVMKEKEREVRRGKQVKKTLKGLPNTSPRCVIKEEHSPFNTPFGFLPMFNR